MKIFSNAAAIFSGAILFVAGCAASGKSETVFENRVFLTNENAVSVVSAEEFFRTAKARVFPHRLAADYRDEHWEADGVLKISGDGLRVVATTPAGRIFTLNWARDGRLDFEKNALFGAPVNPWYLLMDLTLIFGDTETLARHFSPPWKFEENAGARTLFCGSEKIAEIEFSSTEDANGNALDLARKTRIHLKNFVRGYEYFLTEF